MKEEPVLFSDGRDIRKLSLGDLEKIITDAALDLALATQARDYIKTKSAVEKECGRIAADAVMDVLSPRRRD